MQLSVIGRVHMLVFVNSYCIHTNQKIRPKPNTALDNSPHMPSLVTQTRRGMAALEKKTMCMGLFLNAPFQFSARISYLYHRCLHCILYANTGEVLRTAALALASGKKMSRGVYS